ncbi:hypothetical protein EZS27_030027 [termite gut metagenome]|uniref:Uncharacterized protein n=1 Tax=termite gut metagenome TaxID=433724 RepID=A0A5J4QF09_9ZZZZ
MPNEPGKTKQLECKAGSSASGHALFLTNIEYPEEVFLISNTPDKG